MYLRHFCIELGMPNEHPVISASFRFEEKKAKQSGDAKQDQTKWEPLQIITL